MSNLLSVVIITKNEENFIEEAIKSASFAQEVIVVDSNSSDETKNLSIKSGARVFNNEWPGFGKQKNLAVSLSTNEWVFVLDADERITPSLRIEILKVLENPLSDGYLVPRLNRFFGRNIKSCGLYPDFSIRLFKKSKGSFNQVSVHESVKINGAVSKLYNHMIHLAYENEDEFEEKQKKYAKLSYKKKSILKAILSPCWTFFKIYFIKYGFIEGRHGFIIAKVYAKYTFWKYIK